MERYWQSAALVLLAVIIGLTLGSQKKEIGLLLTMAVCCMVAMVAIGYLQPVMEFVQELQLVGQLDNGMLAILLKVVGIGLVGEIASLICCDGGNAALGKALQLLSTATIIWLSLPLLSGLLEMIQEILGEV